MKNLSAILIAFMLTLTSASAQAPSAEVRSFLKIEDVENVVTVFKDGLGYDSARLIEAVRGQVGIP
jgi:hypothetical protein